VTPRGLLLVIGRSQIGLLENIPTNINALLVWHLGILFLKYFVNERRERDRIDGED